MILFVLPNRFNDVCSGNKVLPNVCSNYHEFTNFWIIVQDSKIKQNGNNRSYFENRLMS